MNEQLLEKIRIIHEDQNLLVLEKPSGLIVNRSDTAKEGTLQDFLDDYLGLEYDPESDDPFVQRSGLAHRLDKGTSGVLIAAKNSDALNKLMRMFKERKVLKNYVALVHGEVEHARMEVKAPTGRNPKNRRKFAVVKGGRDSTTYFTKTDSSGVYTLMKVKPYTGRTHQIRVHAVAIGHSIVGDRLYAPPKLLEEDLTKFGRLMLHAKSIEFTLPGKKKKLAFEAKVPSEFFIPFEKY